MPSQIQRPLNGAYGQSRSGAILPLKCDASTERSKAVRPVTGTPKPVNCSASWPRAYNYVMLMLKQH
jgi:hypothetical protein